MGMMEKENIGLKMRKMYQYNVMIVVLSLIWETRRTVGLLLKLWDHTSFDCQLVGCVTTASQSSTLES